jgi:hypothetical protein
MNKFINFRDGRVNVTSYRYTDHQVTTLTDLITCAVAGSDNYLTAIFDADELCNHPDAYSFLAQYGVKCGSQHLRHNGTELFFMLTEEEFKVFTNNNTVVVVVGWGE